MRIEISALALLVRMRKIDQAHWHRKRGVTLLFDRGFPWTSLRRFTEFIIRIYSNCGAAFPGRGLLQVRKCATNESRTINRRKRRGNPRNGARPRTTPAPSRHPGLSG